MDSNFVVTRDEKVKDFLLKKGLELLNHNDGVYVFLNSPILTFSETIKSKLVFTNKLFF